MAPFFEESKLQEIQRINVRIAQADGFREHRLALEQMTRAANFKHAPHAALVFLPDAAEDGIRKMCRANQCGVSRRDIKIGFGEGSFCVIDEHGKIRPATIHFAQEIESGCLTRMAEIMRPMGKGKLFQREAESVPRREKLARLRPGKDPGNGSEIVHQSRPVLRPAAAGPRPKRQLLD